MMKGFLKEALRVLRLLLQLFMDLSLKLLKLYGIADHLTIMGPLKVITPYFLDLRHILKIALHAEVNIVKPAFKFSNFMMCLHPICLESYTSPAPSSRPPSPADSRSSLCGPDGTQRLGLLTCPA